MRIEELEEEGGGEGRRGEKRREEGEDDPVAVQPHIHGDGADRGVRVQDTAEEGGNYGAGPPQARPRPNRRQNHRRECVRAHGGHRLQCREDPEALDPRGRGS